MSSKLPSANRLPVQRRARNWSQAELARRAGISRAAVSAIEVNRLVPSVAAALALARVLECSVEELFGRVQFTETQKAWAWTPQRSPTRYWQAEVGQQMLRYPVEATPANCAHDGIWHADKGVHEVRADAPSTLVMATCDPAAGLLAKEYERSSGYRLLVLPRSSHKALALLKEDKIHVAGMHLAAEQSPDGNFLVVRRFLGAGHSLLHVSKWQEGLTHSAQNPIRKVADALRPSRSWVGREPGSGARQCLDELFPRKPRLRRFAFDHRGVAEAVRCGWADVGVCLRLVSEEAGLDFFVLREEAYELCFADPFRHDPRLQALIRVIRSPVYRNLVAALPGYNPALLGQMRRVD